MFFILITDKILSNFILYGSNNLFLIVLVVSLVVMTQRKKQENYAGNGFPVGKSLCGLSSESEKVCCELKPGNGKGPSTGKYQKTSGCGSDCGCLNRPQNIGNVPTKHSSDTYTCSGCDPL